MAVAQHFAVAHLAAGINRGVVFPIADHIVVPAHQGADDAHIGLKARAEGNDPFFMQKAGQGLLQLQVQLQGAVEKPGAAAAGAELFHGAANEPKHRQGQENKEDQGGQGDGFFLFLGEGGLVRHSCLLAAFSNGFP